MSATTKRGATPQFDMALRRVLRSDAFYSVIEPYRAIWCIALPPDQRRDDAGSTSASTRVEASGAEDAPCAKCWGVSASNAYHNLASARGVAMVRTPGEVPASALARMVFGSEKSGVPLGGLLLAPTTEGAVTAADAERVAELLTKTDARFANVPFGFWDGRSDVDSWRSPEDAKHPEEDARAPAAARVARGRLQAFLESTQGALNTFG